MDWMLALWLLLIGLVAGTVGSLVGLGGGIIIVPSLLVLGLYFPQLSSITAPVAVGTSLVLIVLTALSSTLSYTKQKRVDFSSGWLFFLASGPGSMLGAYLTQYFKSQGFLVAFGCLMIFVSWILRVKDRARVREIRWDVKRVFRDAEGNVYEYGIHRWTAFTISFFIGMLAGLFGIGGGSLMVPMMMLLFRFPPHVATATSMFVIFLSSITASLAHFAQGNIDWFAVIFLAPGAWIGGRLGAYISSKLSGRTLVQVLRIALIVMAIRMILNGLNLA